MKVDVAQHVSGVLTSKQSSKGRAGYQTIFYTQESLTKDEINSIESQVQNNSAQNGTVKWQSYRLTEQRHVISRIMPINEPDESGRRGRFLTHSLIFNVPDGSQLDQLLFDLLRPQNFFSSLDEVLASESLNTGHIRHASIDAKREWVNEAESLMREWSGEQLNQLFMLMRAPHQLMEQGHYIAIIGSEEHVLSALKVAFLLTPTVALKFCAFDTDVSGSDEQSGVTFWGRGFPSSAGRVNHIIDAMQRQVIIPAGSPLQTGGFSLDRFSGPLREAIAAQFSRPSEQMLRSLLHRKYEIFIGEPIYRALLCEPTLSLTASDLELLTPLSKMHLGLGLALALKYQNEALRLQVLAALDDSPSYKERVGEIRTWPNFKAWQAFSPVFMSTWFLLFRGTYSLDDIITAITKVWDHGTAQDRKYILDIHEHLDLAERQELSGWLKDSSNNFNKLRASLDKSIKASMSPAGKPNSLLRRILRLSDK